MNQINNFKEIFSDFLIEFKFFKRILHFLWILFTTIEHGFKNFFPKNYLIRITLTWFLTLTLFILFTSCLIPLFFIKLLILIYLKLKYKSNFGGFFRSQDILWVVEDKSALNIVNILILIKINPLKTDLKLFITDLIKNRFFQSKKMTSIRKFFLGYGYFLLNQLKIADVLTFVKNGICNKNDLNKLIGRFANRCLPKNNLAAFEVIVCLDPIFLEENDNNNGNNNSNNNNHNNNQKYAILLRVHHSIADGINLMSFLNEKIGDKNQTLVKIGIKINTKIDTKIESKIESKIVPKIEPKIQKNSKNSFNLKENFNKKAHLHTLIAKKDKNQLKKPNLSGEKTIAFKIESKIDLLKKVKHIKSSVSNCTFTTVILTCISISLHNYLMRTYKKSPKNIILTFMAVPDKNQLHFNHKELKNIFSMGTIHLPINFGGEKVSNGDVLRRLNEVIEEYKRFEKSCDIWVHYWQLKSFCNLIPRSLVKFILDLNDVTSVTFSNLPGLKEKITIMGEEVSDMMFWVPNYATIGAGFSLLTYDDRFQMGFLVDKNIIANDEEAQEILDDVFKNINELYNLIMT